MCINIHIFLYACITFQILSSSLTKYIFFVLHLTQRFPEKKHYETFWLAAEPPPLLKEYYT